MLEEDFIIVLVRVKKHVVWVVRLGKKTENIQMLGCLRGRRGLSHIAVLWFHHSQTANGPHGLKTEANMKVPKKTAVPGVATGGWLQTWVNPSRPASWNQHVYSLAQKQLWSLAATHDICTGGCVFILIILHEGSNLNKLVSLSGRLGVTFIVTVLKRPFRRNFKPILEIYYDLHAVNSTNRPSKISVLQFSQYSGILSHASTS